MIRKKPWNLVDSPVYSLCVGDDDAWNMNICTYVTPVTLRPKSYVVAVAQGTYTHELIGMHSEAVLQLLAEDQCALVRVLGRKSGKSYDKQGYLNRRQMLTRWEGMPVLRQAVAWLHLHKRSMLEAGDHILFLMDVIRYKVNREAEVLTNAFLVEHKIIRA